MPTFTCENTFLINFFRNVNWSGVSLADFVYRSELRFTIYFKCILSK